MTPLEPTTVSKSDTVDPLAEFHNENTGYLRLDPAKAKSVRDAFTQRQSSASPTAPPGPGGTTPKVIRSTG
ncbi:hypothetical protein [Streptomyces shenzhenensis]|uniref:hypothetical protein n=1 Tax=Streptomyces shenzhenensis TaxID=943815 RepID=UPI0015F036E6|nr:hypothetical protein [Streptomyces shenzhenensis]